VLTTAGPQLGSLIGQTVIVEKLFSWPGVGSLWSTRSSSGTSLSSGMYSADHPVFLCVNLAVDLLYAAIDPRIEYR
jgi:peptide/nickel transport system permease protein